jgi:hypothetical protein
MAAGAVASAMRLHATRAIFFIISRLPLTLLLLLLLLCSVFGVLTDVLLQSSLVAGRLTTSKKDRDRLVR